MVKVKILLMRVLVLFHCAGNNVISFRVLLPPSLMLASSVAPSLFNDKNSLPHKSSTNNTRRKTSKSGFCYRSLKSDSLAAKVSKNTEERTSSQRSSSSNSKLDEQLKEMRLNTFNKKLQEMFDSDSTEQSSLITQEYCDDILGMCVACNQWDTVLDILEIMNRNGYKQQHSTYTTSIKHCFDASNGASARSVLDSMTHANVKPDPTDIAMVVGAMCRNEKSERGMWWKKALHLLTTSTTPSDEAGGNNNKANDNRKVIGSDNNSVIPVDAYDAVLTCMMSEKHGWKDSLRLLRRMESDNSKCNGQHYKNPKPQLSTYRLVIENCVKAGQIEQAVQVLSSMHSQNKMMPTSYTFELVISALSKVGNFKRSLNLLDLMDELKIPKTLLIYNAVISACAKAKEVGTAKNLMFKMKKNDDLKPDVITYNSFMAGCAKTGRWKDAMNTLQQMTKNDNVTPDVITYTNAIRSCTRGGNTKLALDLYNKIKSRPDINLDVYLYTAVIDACSKGRMSQKALQILDEMTSSGVMPNKYTYSVAISACGASGEFEKALDLIKEMKNKRINVNIITYNAAITALSKASKKINGNFKTKNQQSSAEKVEIWQLALDLLEQMKKDNIKPDGFSYSAAINTCGSCGRYKEALHLIDTMKKSGTRPNKIAYTSAISACGSCGEFESALQLFDQMKNIDKLQPDTISYNTLISALRASNQADKAFEIWEEMCRQTSGREAKGGKMQPFAVAHPNVVTVTDIITTLTIQNGKDEDARSINDRRIDRVFEDAVKLGVLMRGDNLDTSYEIDISGMSLPVARAACRYILHRALVTEYSDDARSKNSAQNSSKVIGDLNLITGIRRGKLPSSTSAGHNTMPLREFVQRLLLEEFHPPIETTIPERAQGTVCIEAETLKRWIDAQANE